MNYQNDICISYPLSPIINLLTGSTIYEKPIATNKKTLGVIIVLILIHLNSRGAHLLCKVFYFKKIQIIPPAIAPIISAFSFIFEPYKCPYKVVKISKSVAFLFNISISYLFLFMK